MREVFSYPITTKDSLIMVILYSTSTFWRMNNTANDITKAADFARIETSNVANSKNNNSISPMSISSLMTKQCVTAPTRLRGGTNLQNYPLPSTDGSNSGLTATLLVTAPRRGRPKKGNPLPSTDGSNSGLTATPLVTAPRRKRPKKGNQILSSPLLHANLSTLISSPSPNAPKRLQRRRLSAQNKKLNPPLLSANDSSLAMPNGLQTMIAQQQQDKLGRKRRKTVPKILNANSSVPRIGAQGGQITPFGPQTTQVGHNEEIGKPLTIGQEKDCNRTALLLNAINIMQITPSEPSPAQGRITPFGPPTTQVGHNEEIGKPLTIGQEKDCNRTALLQNAINIMQITPSGPSPAQGRITPFGPPTTQVGQNEELGNNLTIEEQIELIFDKDLKAPSTLKLANDMIGQRNVKRTFITLHHRLRLSQEQFDSNAFTCNAVFEGNPGTGKSMASRIYAEFLQHLGLVGQFAKFVEISSSKLNLEGIMGFKDELRKLSSVLGNIILIEDAQKLLSSIEGKRILDHVLSMARQKKTIYGEITWLLSGPQKDMRLLFEENPEVRSRFPIKFIFKNFDDGELMAIFKRLMDLPIPFRCQDERHLRVGISRLGRQRCLPGFDNACAVQTYFEQVRCRQAVRIKKERNEKGQLESTDIFVFTREDLLGPQVSYEALTSSPAYRKLQSMEGLAAVKQSVEALIKLAVDNARREEEEKPPLDIVINRLFLGNPGTGKTTVARIYAQLLTEMGLLSKGEVIYKCASDFLGVAVGMSEKKTKDILSSAQGSVLVIDEAYSFYAGDGVNQINDVYRRAVIDTIVEQVPAKPGDDRAVLLLGYKKEMEMMLKNMNPGLPRRFQLENAFHFEDYDDEALIRILLAQTKEASLKIEHSVAKRAVGSLALARARPHFGNAGTLENMLSEAKLRMSPGSDELTLKDFGLGEELSSLDLVDGLFEDLVGCHSVKTKMQELRDTILFAQSRGDDPKHLVSYNYLFTGNPGTGKTTVARRMGKAYKALGLLPDDSMLEVSASDLITGYTGQAGRKTRDVMERSRGSVLFIDEAYQLNPQRGGQYMTEVVDELVKCLTMPDFQGKSLVILAGYGAEMDQMLNVNQGLRSRFAERLEFESMGAWADHCAELMARKMAQKRLPLSAMDRDQLPTLAKHLVESEGFSNGRDVETWSSLAYQQIARRGVCVGTEDSDAKGFIGDLEHALNKVLASRAVNKKEKDAGITTMLRLDAVQGFTASASRQPLNFAHQIVEEKVMLQEENNTERVSVGSASDRESVNPFANIDLKVLQAIQDGLAKQNMHSMEEVSSVAALDSTHVVVKELLRFLTTNGIAASDPQALALFREWQQAHQLTKEQAAEISKDSRTQAIWRCAACGRGGYPYIVCSVAPYIERYEEVPEL